LVWLEDNRVIGTPNRLLRVTLVLCAVGLSACSQTITNSTIVVDEKFLSDDEKERLVDEVYKKATELGGNCRLVSEQRQYHRCIFNVSGGETSIGVGYNAKQRFLISVSSMISHGIPPADDKVVSGYYLPELHRKLEAWALSLVPPEAAITAERSYVGYDASEELR